MAEVIYYGTGRRKSSVARVRLVPGEGKVTINGRDMEEYFGLKTLELIVRQPLNLTETVDKYDVIANVAGGGVTGQAGAIRHGIAQIIVVHQIKTVAQENLFQLLRPLTVHLHLIEERVLPIACCFHHSRHGILSRVTGARR